MKKISFFVCLLMGGLCVSCGGDDDPGEEPIVVPPTGIEATFKVDTEFKATASYIQNTWAGEYEGYDAAQEKNTKIKRKLVLNPNKTYVNTIEGILVSSGKNEYTAFEKEEGTYSYDSSTGTVTYTVRYDSLIDYKTQHYIGYKKKHYYSADGMNANDKAVYTEKAMFTKIGDDGSNRKWVTEDTYLQQLTDKELDLYFTMDIFKEEK
ncbi:MAG: hypothetical protein ACI4D4_01970 [Lachnospira sp.]